METLDSFRLLEKELRPESRQVKSLMLETLPLITLAAAVVGALWMGYIAYKKGQPLWALACTLTLGIVAIVYGFRNLKTCLFPTILCVVGVVGRIVLEVIK